MKVISVTNFKEAQEALRRTGTTARGLEIMAEKAIFQVLFIEKVDTRGANILKQTLLSYGGEAAVSAGTINLAVPYTDVVIMATVAQLRLVIKRLKEQPWGLKKIAKDLEEHLEKL